MIFMIYACVCVFFNIKPLRPRPILSELATTPPFGVQDAELRAAGFAPRRPRTEDASGGGTSLAALVRALLVGRIPSGNLT